jgi:hypothetical protein
MISKIYLCFPSLYKISNFIKARIPIIVKKSYKKFIRQFIYKTKSSIIQKILNNA